jgi:hypothetical protein
MILGGKEERMHHLKFEVIQWSVARMIPLAIAFMVGVAPQPSPAEVITYVFDGVIEEINGNTSIFEEGDAFSGEYVIESNWVGNCHSRMSALPNLTCFYGSQSPPFGFEVRLSGVVIKTGGDDRELAVCVQDVGKVRNEDGYFWYSLGNLVEGAMFEVDRVTWELRATPGPYSNANLPTSVSLDDWDGNLFRIESGCIHLCEGDNFTLWGTVTSLARIVTIDIKPSSGINAINPMGQGIVPVAVFGSPTFDVLDVDPTTIAFGSDAAPLAHRNGPHLEDIDEDGYGDMLAHFRVQETGIAVADTEACLTAELVDGSEIEGCDVVRTEPDCGGGGLAAVFVLPPLAWLGARVWRRRRSERSADPHQCATVGAGT